MKNTNNANIFSEITDDILKNLNIFIGGRGLGKTFSVLKHRVLNAVESGKKFIWLRDTQTIVDKIAAGGSLTAPIEAKVKDFPHVEIQKIRGNYCFVKIDADQEEGTVIGYLMALSTFHNSRGVSYEDVDCLVWDEMIPEEGVTIQKNQGAIFLNMYETVNRNREMFGEPPVQIIFLSNANDIFSDVLSSLNVDKIIEDMAYNGISKYEDDDIVIMLMSNDKFLEQKKNTFIYRIQNNEKFAESALNNKFTNNLALVKRNVNLKKANPIINLDGRYVLVELADGTLYWKSGTYKNIMNYDMDNEQEALLFRYLFSDKLRIPYVSGKMFFDSIYTQRIVLDFAKL